MNDHPSSPAARMAAMWSGPAFRARHVERLQALHRDPAWSAAHRERSRAWCRFMNLKPSEIERRLWRRFSPVIGATATLDAIVEGRG